MSAMDIDARKNGTGVLQYAPPQYRTSDEATILPVLERLGRGEPEHASGAAAAEPVPHAEPIRMRGAASSSKFPLSMTGRLAVAMSVIAAVMTVSATFLPSKAQHPVPIKVLKAARATKPQQTVVPQTVHTVPIRQEATAVSGARLSSAAPPPVSPPPQASVADRGSGAWYSDVPRAEMARSLTAPLQVWAMFPDDGSTAARPAGAPSDAHGGQSDAKGPASKPATAASHRTATATRHVRRHRRHVARHRSHRRYRRRTRAAAARPQRLPPAQQQADATQPIKKMPIQAALDRLFGNTDDGASGAAAPASAGTAFR